MKRRKSIGLLLLIPVFLAGCSETETAPTPMNKQPTGAYTGHLVSKSSLVTIDSAAGSEELYLRLGMGDFYIQFSESNVTEEQLRPLLDQVISVEGEIRDGEWDADPAEVESRVGQYLVITRLLP